MAFCTSCGSQLNEGSAFCTGCGKTVDGASANQTAQQQTSAPPPQSTINAEKIKEIRELVKSWGTHEMFEYLYKLECTHADLKQKTAQQAPPAPMKPEKPVINIPYPVYQNTAIFISGKKLEAQKQAYYNLPEYTAAYLQWH